MVVSALMAMALTHAGVDIPRLFLVTGLLNVLVATYIYSLVPEFLLRFVAWVLVHIFYRIRLVHAERIPETTAGGAVLQPCQLCQRASDRRGQPAADSLRDGSPDLQHALRELGVPPRQDDPDHTAP